MDKIFEFGRLPRARSARLNVENRKPASQDERIARRRPRLRYARTGTSRNLKAAKDISPVGGVGSDPADVSQAEGVVYPSCPMRGKRSKSTPAALAGLAAATIAAVGGSSVTVPDRGSPHVEVPNAAGTTPVELAALIIATSSTNPAGDGVADFYGGLYRQSPTVIANFLTGAPGIYAAIHDNRHDDDNVVLSSGWGAANASLLLTYEKAVGGADKVASQPNLYVLDDNVATPNGGFGTRLPVFALLGVNPLPTPTDPGVRVVNVAYEYDINSNIPAYIWNVPAMTNSLMAYFERRLNQGGLDFPVDANGQVRDCDAGCQAQLDSGETITRLMADGQTVRITKVDDTTYVGYQSNGLPLVAPLRSLGEPGNLIADAATPALRAVVDYGYPDNDPLGAPQDYVPARLIPRPQETATFLHQFADGLRQGAKILEDDAAQGSDTVVVDVKSAPDDEATTALVTKPRRPAAAGISRVTAADSPRLNRADGAKRNPLSARPRAVPQTSKAPLKKRVKRIADGPRRDRHTVRRGEGGTPG